jgi:YhcG PDDEXK nuclease domain
LNRRRQDPSRHLCRDRQATGRADEPGRRGLQGAYSERDLEGVFLREIEGMLLGPGAGLTFVVRQNRMSVGKDDFYLDLSFFRRHLRRLMAVEPKLDRLALPMSARCSCVCAG